MNTMEPEGVGPIGAAVAGAAAVAGGALVVQPGACVAGVAAGAPEGWVVGAAAGPHPATKPAISASTSGRRMSAPVTFSTVARRVVGPATYGEAVPSVRSGNRPRARPGAYHRHPVKIQGAEAELLLAQAAPVPP